MYRAARRPVIFLDSHKFGPVTPATLAEPDEFAEALLDQLSVEFNEEEEIAKTVSSIDDDSSFAIEFETLKEISDRLLPECKRLVEEFTGMHVPESIKIDLTGLIDFKRLKARKVFVEDASREYVDRLFLAVAQQNKDEIAGLVTDDPARYLAYSTYAKNYLSQISTTYGDILDDTIHLNRFVLESYPKIILYKSGPPFNARIADVKSGYLGALKMTILEETVHSVQTNLQEINRRAVINVNSINEDCARMILDLDEDSANQLYEYLQLQTVPDHFPLAKKANLFFFLDPNFFLVEQLGPDIMTYTGIRIDPKISLMAPGLLDVYHRWLGPMQTHHSAFTVMEGMAEHVIQSILDGDADFENYLSTFMGTDLSSYRVRKNIGRDFTKAVSEKIDLATLDGNLPSTRELRDPEAYIKRITA